MSSKFAVIENNIVENIIVCENKEIAESVTGKLCVEYTDENPAFIGLSWSQQNGFEQPFLGETDIDDFKINKGDI